MTFSFLLEKKIIICCLFFTYNYCYVYLKVVVEDVLPKSIFETKHIHDTEDETNKTNRKSHTQ